MCAYSPVFCSGICVNEYPGNIGGFTWVASDWNYTIVIQICSVKLIEALDATVASQLLGSKRNRVSACISPAHLTLSAHFADSHFGEHVCIHSRAPSQAWAYGVQCEQRFVGKAPGSDYRTRAQKWRKLRARNVKTARGTVASRSSLASTILDLPNLCECRLPTTAEITSP